MYQRVSVMMMLAMLGLIALSMAGCPREASDDVAAAPVTSPSGDVERLWEQPGTAAGQEVVGPDGATLVWVPSGNLMMGSEDGRDDEKPVHQVELDGFWLGKHEVTNAQYRTFCEATGREFPSESDQGDAHPAVYVLWSDAKSYCEHYDLSLPTEAQWEYAARGSDGRVYPWGDRWAPDKLCWGRNKGPGEKTFPVGSFPAGASWCGALDMAGNVGEWCADRYDHDYYAEAPVKNPPGPGPGVGTFWRDFDGTLVAVDAQVWRDGAWGFDRAVAFRCAGRSFSRTAFRYNCVGFRCARTP